jgi:hypothetical protein
VLLTTTVGRYRDQADIRLIQTFSALRDNLPNMDDYDDRDIGFDITAISDPTNPYGVRSGQRDYEIFNEGSVATRAVNHPGVPIWYGGEVLEQSIGLNTTNNVPVGFSTLQQLQDWINGGRPGAPTNGRRSILVTGASGTVGGFQQL